MGFFLSIFPIQSFLSVYSIFPIYSIF